MAWLIVLSVTYVFISYVGVYTFCDYMRDNSYREYGYKERVDPEVFLCYLFGVVVAPIIVFIWLIIKTGDWLRKHLN